LVKAYSGIWALGNMTDSGVGWGVWWAFNIWLCYCVL